MGNCKCDFHIYGLEPESNMEPFGGNQGINSNRPMEINSQYSQMSSMEQGPKLKQTNKNLEKKISQMGNIISENEFNNIINKDINNYIKKNVINFKDRIPQNISTFQLEPIKFKNNNIYYGNWNNNCQMEGYGIYYLNDNKVITEGVWNKGDIIYGRIFLTNGDIYIGEMKNSLPDGKGKYIFANKDIYEGDFKQGDMTGKGIFIFFPDNTKYQGDIEKGFFNGKGKMIWNNGVEYSGEFLDSYLNGNGTITSNIQNEKYHGMFEKNEFHGKGIYYYRNGDIYDGNFEYGIKSGYGKYTRNDKVEFEGFWNDDLANGNGILTYRGNSLKGYFRNGVFIENSENEENNDAFKNINKDIKPDKFSILPNSLPHLAIADSNASQYISGNFI